MLYVHVRFGNVSVSKFFKSKMIGLYAVCEGFVYFEMAYSFSAISNAFRLLLNTLVLGLIKFPAVSACLLLALNLVKNLSSPRLEVRKPKM